MNNTNLKNTVLSGLEKCMTVNYYPFIKNRLEILYWIIVSTGKYSMMIKKVKFESKIENSAEETLQKLAIKVLASYTKHILEGRKVLKS